MYGAVLFKVDLRHTSAGERSVCKNVPFLQAWCVFVLVSGTDLV